MTMILAHGRGPLPQDNAERWHIRLSDLGLRDVDQSRDGAVWVALPVRPVCRCGQAARVTCESEWPPAGGVVYTFGLECEACGLRERLTDVLLRSHGAAQRVAAGAGARQLVMWG